MMVRGVGEDLVEFFVDIIDIKLTVRDLGQLFIDLFLDTWDKLAIFDDSVELALPFLQILDLISCQMIGKQLCNKRFGCMSIVACSDFFGNREHKSDFFVSGNDGYFLANIKNFFRINVHVLNTVLDLVGINVRHMTLDFVSIDMQMRNTMFGMFFEGDSCAHNGRFYDCKHRN